MVEAQVLNLREWVSCVLSGTQVRGRTQRHFRVEFCSRKLIDLDPEVLRDKTAMNVGLLSLITV